MDLTKILQLATLILVAAKKFTKIFTPKEKQNEKTPSK